MTLREYNNQTLLTIPDTKPINDDYAKERGNSLRLLATSTEADKWFECRNMCMNNKDCELYKFDGEGPEGTICKLYRKEPYKEIVDIKLETCTKACSLDKDCDYLSHSVDNKCTLHTRENLNESGKTAIGDLWFPFSIYGLNIEKGVTANSFNRCRYKLQKNERPFVGGSGNGSGGNNKSGHQITLSNQKPSEISGDYFVYYDKSKYCIPKRFFEQSPGNTLIYFNKEPVDKYKSISKFIGLKSANKEKVESYKTIAVIVWISAVFLFLLFFCLFFGRRRKNKT
jgi:hypothetical protein